MPSCARSSDREHVYSCNCAKNEYTGPSRMAPVKGFQYETQTSSAGHLQDFVSAYKLQLQIEDLEGSDHSEFICQIWKQQPGSFTLNPLHQRSNQTSSVPFTRGHLSQIVGSVRLAFDHVTGAIESAQETKRLFVIARFIALPLSLHVVGGRGFDAGFYKRSPGKDTAKGMNDLLVLKLYSFGHIDVTPIILWISTIESFLRCHIGAVMSIGAPTRDRPVVRGRLGHQIKIRKGRRRLANREASPAGPPRDLPRLRFRNARSRSGGGP